MVMGEERSSQNIGNSRKKATDFAALEGQGDLVLQEDLEIVAKDSSLATALQGKTIVVTGATGLVGREMILCLACMNRVQNNGMTIVGIIRNKKKAEQVFGREFLSRDDVRFIEADFLDEDFATKASHDLVTDMVIHGAAMTASKDLISHPVEAIMTAVDGTKRALDFARISKAGAFVYLSSMEMYGTLEGEATEEKLGWIDLHSVRSDYPESKRLCETLCIGYGSEYNLGVKIARLSQTFGAGVSKDETRVFAQFARSVIQGKDIVLHTTGRSEGNYCYTRDTVRGILTIATKGKEGEAYNVANEASHTTIADMAHLIADKIAHGRIKVVYDIPEGNQYGYAADTRLKLNASKLRSLGWRPEVGLEESYRRMIASMEYQISR